MLFLLACLWFLTSLSLPSTVSRLLPVLLSSELILSGVPEMPLWDRSTFGHINAGSIRPLDCWDSWLVVLFFLLFLFVLQ